MQRPSFQFYPGDWLSNKNLKRCSFHLKGIWMDIMCLMHDSDEYGVLRWTIDEIANAIGCENFDIEELLRLNILKGSNNTSEKVSFYPSFSKRKGYPEIVTLIDSYGPLFYSSRMVRDEYVRQKRAQHGIKSLENPNVPQKKTHEKDTFSKHEKDTILPSPSSSSSSSSSSSNNKKNIYSVEAQKVLDHLNEKTGRHFSKKDEIISRLREGHTAEEHIRIIDTKIHDPFFLKDNMKLLNPVTLFRKSHFDIYLNQNPNDFDSDGSGDRYTAERLQKLAIEKGLYKEENHD